MKIKLSEKVFFINSLKFFLNIEKVLQSYKLLQSFVNCFEKNNIILSINEYCDHVW